MNIISPLLADFENEKQVPTEVVKLNKLFVKMQEALNKLSNGITVVIKCVFRIKAKYYLGEA